MDAFSRYITHCRTKQIALVVVADLAVVGAFSAGLISFQMTITVAALPWLILLGTREVDVDSAQHDAAQLAARTLGLNYTPRLSTVDAIPTGATLLTLGANYEYRDILQGKYDGQIVTAFEMSFLYSPTMGFKGLSVCVWTVPQRPFHLIVRPRNAETNYGLGEAWNPVTGGRMSISEDFDREFATYCVGSRSAAADALSSKFLGALQRLQGKGYGFEFLLDRLMIFTSGGPLKAADYKEFLDDAAEIRRVFLGESGSLAQPPNTSQ